MEGRAAAKNYLSNYTTLNKIVNDNANSYSNPGRAMDSIVSNITSASQDVLTDIIWNLNTNSERNKFEDVYRILRNEAYQECLGFYRDGSTFMDEYKNEKATIARFADFDFDLEQEYGANNFINVTNLMDQLLNSAVNNINSRQGLNLRPSDVRQIINLNFAAQSLRSMHERIQASVKHTSSSCVMYCPELGTIKQAVLDASRLDDYVQDQEPEQDQDQFEQEGPATGMIY